MITLLTRMGMVGGVMIGWAVKIEYQEVFFRYAAYTMNTNGGIPENL